MVRPGPLLLLLLATAQAQAQAADGAVGVDANGNLQLTAPGSVLANGVNITQMYADVATLMRRALPALAPAALTLRVATTNIRYDNSNDKFGTVPASWSYRRALYFEVVRRFGADLLGIQEAPLAQLDDLRTELTASFRAVPGYPYTPTGEHSAIFFSRERFTLLQTGCFWLCNRPENFYCRHPSADLPRVCNWVVLRDEWHPDKRHVLLINTHWSHVSSEARDFSARLVRKRAAALLAAMAPGTALVLTGDFNTRSPEDSFPYTHLTDSGLFFDTYTAIHGLRSDDSGTMHTFSSLDAQPWTERIDWVLSSPVLLPVDSKVDRTVVDGRAASDHFFVFSTLAWGAPAALPTLIPDVYSVSLSSKSPDNQGSWVLAVHREVAGDQPSSTSTAPIVHQMVQSGNNNWLWQFTGVAPNTWTISATRTSGSPSQDGWLLTLSADTLSVTTPSAQPATEWTTESQGDGTWVIASGGYYLVADRSSGTRDNTSTYVSLTVDQNSASRWRLLPVIPEYPI